MQIKYLGHSCFALTDGAGTAIVCDPYDPSVGFRMPFIEADAITVSHHHYDHDYVCAVSGNPKIYDKSGSYRVSNVDITGLNSFHDEKNGALRGKNVIFRFRMDGTDVCHLGDLGESFSPELVKAVAHVNVLLIPVGGTYTIDASTAKQYVEAIKPNVVIPMHYRTGDCKLDIDGVNGFLSLFDSTVKIQKSTNEINLSLDDIQGKKTKIIVMDKE